MSPLAIWIILGILVTVAILFAGKQGKTIQQQNKIIADQKVQLQASERINKMINGMKDKTINCTIEQTEKCMNIMSSSLPPTTQEKYMKEVLEIQE